MPEWNLLHITALAILYWPLAILLASLLGKHLRKRDQESDLLVKAKALQRIERSRWQ